MKLPDFLKTAPPAAALSIDADRVTAVSVTTAAGRTIVSSHASERLPQGAVVASLAASNVLDRAAVAGAIRQVIRRIEPKPRMIALVVPDMVGKVSIVRFEKVPARAADLEQMVRFQVRKTAPFRIEDAQVTWTHGSSAGDGAREFVTVVARRDVISEYEGVCEEAGLHAGIVDLATFNVINLVLSDAAARPKGDWLLVHVAPGWATMAIMRGPDLIFFRNRADEEERNLAAMVHQTAMYYEDRLGGTGFERVILAAAGEFSDPLAIGELRRSLEGRPGLPVTPLEGSMPGWLTEGTDPALLASLAPLIGVLQRERAA